MDDDKKARLKTATELVRNLRRRLTRELLDAIEKDKVDDPLTLEDNMRLVGTLEAAYNHLLAAIISDGDIYCVIKHLSYALILSGELEKPDVEEIYTIMTIVTNSRIEPCNSCRAEETSAKEE